MSHSLVLLHAAQQGEPRAIAQLLHSFQPDVRRYAQRHCLISDIDDAVQETLLVLARNVQQLQKLAALSSWLFKVVQRSCRRLGRAAFNYDPFEESKVDHWIATRSAEDVGVDLCHALESLPQRYRDVIMLRDFGGLTIAETAARLGVSVAATKSLLHRARELTREYLLA